MKRFIIALSITVMMIVLAGCGGSDNSSEAQTSDTSSDITSVGDWAFVTDVDEFGDVIENSQNIALFSLSTGDFSNTATSKSDLNVRTTFMIVEGKRTFFFDLYEYQKTLATYTSGSDISMKVKYADNTTADYTLYGTPPNGSVMLGINGEAEDVFQSLVDGNDVKCIILIDNSQYNFTLYANGFLEMCDKAKAKAEAKVEAKKSKDNTTAINNILGEEDGSDFLLDAYNYYENNKDSYPVMSDDEIKNEINGDFYSSSFSNNNGFIITYRYIMGFDGKERTQKLYFKEGIKTTAPEEQNESKEYTVDNGFVIYGDTYEVRKISDGYYLFYGPESVSSDKVVLKYFIMKVHNDGTQYTAEYPIPE